MQEAARYIERVRFSIIGNERANFHLLLERGRDIKGFAAAEASSHGVSSRFLSNQAVTIRRLRMC